jgi:hypothetical protein
MSLLILLLNQLPGSHSSIHVSLSHNSGGETIRLLRDFDNEMFLQVHGPELTDKDESLEQMDVVAGCKLSGTLQPTRSNGAMGE